MNVPLTIDLSPLFDQYNLDQKDCDNIVDFTIKEIAAEFVEQWKMTASQNLGSTKNRYIQNIFTVDEGRMTGVVVLDYTKDPMVQMLEEGADAFDMKEGFLNSPKVKTNKAGGKYMVIPFKWGGSDTIKDSDTFSNKMPKEIQTMAKALKPKERITDTKLSKLQKGFESQKTRERIEIPKSKAFEEYTHKSSIYHGITKVKDSVTGQSGTMSFRVVSEKSDENSWIHPGIKAKNIAELALDDFEQKIEPLMTQGINNALINLGFE